MRVEAKTRILAAFKVRSPELFMILRLTCLVCLLLWLSACGYKTDLTLPEEDARTLISTDID